MGEKFSVAYKLDASAGSTDTVNAFTVIAGRKLTLEKVTFIFPTGSNFQLQVKIYKGEQQLIPNQNYIVGDGHVIPINCNVTFESEQPIIVWYNNADTTNAHSCLIIFEGVLD